MLIRLGDHVTDVLTGISGVIWARTEYLTSPPQVCIVSKKSDAGPSETLWCDEDRVMTNSVQDLQMVKYGDIRQPAKNM